MLRYLILILLLVYILYYLDSIIDLDCTNQAVTGALLLDFNTVICLYYRSGLQ